MNDLQPHGKTRRDYLESAGTLAVVEAPAALDLESAPADALAPYVIVYAEGEIVAFNGHVDLGTGIRTALAQIVAEELDVSFMRVTMVLGDTALAPEQGPTIASETIQLAAKPLRRAAAQARHYLVARAAARLDASPNDLTVEDGLVFRPGDNRRLSYSELIGDERIRLALADHAPVKPAAKYSLVGSSAPRVDLQAKATGGLVYVHDMRLPGMLHGRVVRPPHAGFDTGEHVGRSLIRVDEASVASLPGVVATVVLGDFVGVVAEREEQAEAAMRALRVEWRQAPARDFSDISKALLANPSKPRVLLDKGDVEGALANAAKRLKRDYVWPYQMHASIGPSAALVDVRPDGVRAWSGTQNPGWMRRDLAMLLDVPETSVEVIRMEAAGCYGRNGADDVTADAALLSRSVGRPVRVQLTREQEHTWEPKGAAQLMLVDGGLDAAGDVAAYDFSARYPSNMAPTLALLLTGTVAPIPAVAGMGDRTAIGPYKFANHRVTVHDMAPLARAAWLRGVSALPNTFAHESYIDELAAEAGVDPVAYRLRYLDDPRARALIEQTAERASWTPHVGARRQRDEAGRLIGRGFAYAVYVHSNFPGLASAWSAWVADVSVDPENGEVSLTRVTVGQDSGLMINPDGVKHQIHGNVIQSTSRVLKEQVTFSDIAVTSREWGTYPLLTFPEVPPIDVLLVSRPEDEPLGVGESASVPSAAAIANAIYDATGVRFRAPPFTPDKILKGLREARLDGLPLPSPLVGDGKGGGAAPLGWEPVATPFPGPPPQGERGSSRWAWLKPVVAGAFGAAAALAGALLHGPPAFAPIARPDPAAYSAVTIARGASLAAVGGCVYCHTAEGGRALAGGRPFETRYGVLYSTNLTPDETTGVGAWSYEAFARAMRQGVSRDGKYLFPAFPYTSFAKTGEADLQALYAWTIAREPISQPNRPQALKAPFGWRPLMAAWNAIFHRPEPLPDMSGDLFARGKYLVEGLGHCSACHTPRNPLGAELTGHAHFSGAMVDGYWAPPLDQASPAPIPWSESAYYDYLRTGYSASHGAAGGKMAEVVANLKGAPDEDISAMAHYLASYSRPAPMAEAELRSELEAASLARAKNSEYLAGARIYEGACAVCHEPGQGVAMFGVKPSLAVATAIQAATPEATLRFILEGSTSTALPDLGAMPGFAGHLDDAQVADLLAYLRARFAPEKPGWRDAAVVSGRLRRSLGSARGG